MTPSRELSHIRSRKLSCRRFPPFVRPQRSRRLAARPVVCCRLVTTRSGARRANAANHTQGPASAARRKPWLGLALVDDAEDVALGVGEDDEVGVVWIGPLNSRRAEG